jgi:Phage minor capsid protein 2
MTIDDINYASLSDALDKISKDIADIVYKIETTTKFDNIFWQKINNQIEKQYERLRKVTAKWVESEIPDAYQQLLNDQLTQIKYQNLPALSQYNYESFVNSNLAQQGINNIINDTLQTYFKGFLKGEQTLKKLANYTQIINMSENKISGLIAQGIMEKGSAQYSYKLLKDQMLKIAKDEKFITIINKNGKEIHYDVKKYAELVTRTKMQDANSQAVLDTAAGIDADLVQFSSHNTRCPVCAPYEGQIYSLSGKDKDFPRIPDISPLHVNCMHSMTIVFKDALQIEGSLDKYIAFSNGEIDQPPNNKAFIPLDKREYI